MRSALVHPPLLALPLLALLLAWPVRAEPASAQGEWLTEGARARVRIDSCSGDPRTLCGVITWIENPTDANGQPQRDRGNPDPALRQRPIIGLPLLQGFKPDGNGRWSGGTIYDPEEGKTYRSKMVLKAPDRLEVSGCVLVFCRGQVWRRYAP